MRSRLLTLVTLALLTSSAAAQVAAPDALAARAVGCYQLRLDLETAVPRHGAFDGWNGPSEFRLDLAYRTNPQGSTDWRRASPVPPPVGRSFEGLWRVAAPDTLVVSWDNPFISWRFAGMLTADTLHGVMSYSTHVLGPASETVNATVWRAPCSAALEPAGRRR
ncbi:MAG: hypothetical protein KC544_14355 [Gemmatimonadetes bacterium]|nr:hypothetical protein [Gemmatimonadota bacterium]